MSKQAKTGLTQANQVVLRVLFSVDETAAELGLSPATIRSWAYSRKIASHKIGRRLMISRESIDHLLSESLRPRAPEPSAAEPGPAAPEVPVPVLETSNRPRRQTARL